MEVSKKVALHNWVNRGIKGVLLDVKKKKE